MAPGGRSRSSTTSSFTSSLRSESNRAPIAAEATPLALGGKSGGEQALKGQELSGWSPSPAGDGEMGTSYASQHTLKTIRPGAGSRDDSPARSSTSEAETEGSQDEWQRDPTTGQQVKRGNPKFIINLAPTSTNDQSGTGSSNSLSAASSTTQHHKTRDRSATFGGVPLPPSPAPQTSNQPTSSSSNRPRPSITRLPSSSSVSLHLGGDESSFARRRPMLHAGLKAGALFLASLLALYILLKTLLPPIDDEHKDRVKLPKTFDELKGLNEVLQVYKSRHYYRVLGCYTTVYLFLQAFSIPGSMYLSILGGAMYGVVMALPLVCFCVATGALLCYAISSALGPAILLNSEKWQRRVDAWTKRIDGHKENLISYLIVLRIAPLPPHWVVNVVAPHLGISIWTFWISTFFGIAGVSYIHTTIGTTLDQMTSSNDFHLISWQNGVGLGGIVVAVLVPVLLRRLWSKDLEQAAEEEPDDEEELDSSDAEGSRLLRSNRDDEEREVGGWNESSGGGRERPFRLDSDSEDEHDRSDEEEEGKGKGKARVMAVESGGSQGEWEESSVDRRGGVGAGQQTGDLSKASRLLGVTVGR